MKKIEFSGHYYNGHFELSKEVKYEEIKGYFETILEENKINISKLKEELQTKIGEERLIFPGGMTFYNSDKTGITGCCFDLNDIKEACTNIRNSKHTWLGHDPDMIINYTDDAVVFFESAGFNHNIEPEDNKKLEYTKEEINDLINTANSNFKEFIDIFYNYLKNNYSDIADILIEDLKKHLL